MRKILCLLLFWLTFSYDSYSQSKRPLTSIVTPSNGRIASSRIGCSLFTDANNYTNGTTFSYNAPINNNSNLTGTSGTSYGCMGSVPNQAWFIITVTAGGNLYFNFSNSNNYDVDAIIWSALPNNDVANACSSTTTYPLTCDYDATRPDLYINNAQVGQKYVMLVTNYSNANTVINISQPTGGSVTYSMVNLPNCSLTPSATISGTNTTINEGQSANLSLNFTGSAPWTYTLSDGTTGTTFTSPSNITVYPTASQTYTINSVSNLCGTSGGSGGVGISVVRNVQLKSCFPLDGNATDSQGINNGNLQNGVLATTNRANEINKSLQFDGLDDYANIPTNQLNNNTFAFATWLKLDELPNANNPERIALSLGNTGDDHFLGVEYINGNPAWKFSSNGNIVYGNATVNTDWHLLVGVRTGGQMKLYVDGVLSGTIATSGTTIYGTPLSGRLGSGIANNKFFKGKIDDVKFFNGSLIDAEVLLLQNYTSCSNVYSDTFISTQSISTSVICTGTPFTIRAFTNNLPIDNELQFVAELSDANGSFSNPTTIGANSFLPLTATIPSNTQGGNYKIRIRYGGFISVNNFDIFVNNPSTYNVTGTVALNDGQSTNINLNFTGTGPWNYVLSNGLSGIATTNPWQITVNPDQSTVYYLTSASNVCGTTTLNGNSSAIVTVNFTKQFVSCLPFNGNANDENGNNTATVNGPLLTDNRYGQTNAAYSFNGNGNYIDYSTNLLRKREYTMSAWVLANSIPSGTQYIISQGETSTNTFQGLAMTSSGWSFQSYTSNGVYSVGSSSGWAANQWVHLTAVCSYQSLKLYVNGNLVSSTTNNSLIPFKVSDIGRIGANSSIAGNYFNGKIDDIRLYKGALNDDEVYALYSNTTSCPTVENAPIIVSRGISPTTVCAGNTVSVSYTLSNVLVSTGSPLNVILSDQNGSFANPTIIGSGTSSPITATIPLTATNSNFYRIRLVSTNGTPINSVNSNTLIVSGARPTATISGGGSIQNGQSANLSISFTGNSPWNYALNNGANQITSSSPITVPVSPFATTIYTVTSVSNACGSGTSSGSATVTVAPFISLGSLNSTYCTGTNISIPFQANFTPNTNFRVELSDATGGFTAPITIGTGSISPITAQIPNTVAGATGYKIRIVSDNPAITSAVSSILTINQKATATISGTATINEGQTTNLTINFTGTAPYTYTITGGTSQTTSTNLLTIPVSPITNTTYSITSISNAVCGTGTSTGSAVVTVNPVVVRLVSCFPYNGNANDGKGLNNGTLVGDVSLTTDRFGNANSAYSFDGIGDYIQVPSNQLLNNEYSYSVWINPSVIDNIEYIFSITDMFGSGLNALGLSSYQNSINVLSKSSSFSTPIPFSIGQWNHLTVTRSLSSLKLYVNGVLTSSTNIIETNPYVNNSFVTIGALSSGYGPFKGKIDDVQIYKGVLSAGQIQTLYNSSDACLDISTIPILSLSNLVSSSFCTEQVVSLPFSSANVTNPIKVQLSDVNGSFASPTQIGSGNTSPISIQIPNNQIAGTNYKIRLVSSDGTPIISNILSNISIGSPVTATISGTATINEGQTTNLTINFTGTAPYTYTISGGTSQTTSTNPLTIPVSPVVNTTYSITSISNAVCGTGTSTGSAVVTVTYNPELISCYPFNGNLNDPIGSNNITNYSGIAYASDRLGNSNSSLFLDGFNHLIYTSIPKTIIKKHTYSFWMKQTSNTYNSYNIFHIYDPVNIGGYTEGLSISNNISTNQSIISYTNWSTTSTFTVPLVVSEWNHISIIYDSPNVKLFINGQLIETKYHFATPPSFNTSSNSFQMVFNGHPVEYKLTGNIDDLKIYKNALTNDQIAALYSSVDCEDVISTPILSMSGYPTSYCHNQSSPFQVYYNTANFTANQNIQVQLSDATGNFNNPMIIGSSSISPITLVIPNNVIGTGYKIRLVTTNPSIVSRASLPISFNYPVTATISGTAIINEGQTTNLTINFTGTAPYTYTITGGTSKTTSTSSLTIPVSPITNTTYNITSISNAVCGTGTSTGSAVVTVNPVAVRLVSCFPFNGNANDSKGINNGNIIGSLPLTTDRFNNLSSAYNFSDNGYMQVEPASNIFNLEFTTSLWFQSSPNQALNSYYTLMNLSTNTIVLKRKGTGSYSIQFTGMSNFGADFYEFNLTNYNPNQWHSLIFIHSFDKLKLYFDNILIADIPPNPQYIEATYGYPRRIVIGSIENYYWNFQGKIDDVQIYKGVLTAGQVQALYNNNDGCYDASTFICPTNSAYSSILNGQQVLQVSNQITGNNSIQTGSNIHFDAGNVILLQPGFTTEVNSVFKASVGGGCR